MSLDQRFQRKTSKVQFIAHFGGRYGRFAIIVQAIMYMKQLSFFLFVATGLILCATLHAQQYHDAVAFGLKGNVKECTVLQENGTYSSGPYEYSKISFDTDGKLEYWMLDFGLDKKDRMAHLSDITRSNGYLTGFNYSLTPDDSKKYRFHYKDGKLICSYILYTEFDDIFGYLGYTTGNLFNEINDDSFVCVYFSVGAVNNAVTTLIEEQYNTGDDLITSLEFCADGLMTSFKSFQTTYKILEKDARGNYTKLLNTETQNVIYHNITYWDDEPATAKPVQASSYSITSTAPGIKLSTSRELTLKDLIAKPLGVIENPSKSLWGIDPEKVIEYIQGNKEWKCTESYGTYSIREGFNRTFKGYPLDVDVKKYEYVNYSYGYGYYVTMGYKDQETKEAASREMEKLFNIVVKEFRDLGIELTQSQGESWVRAEKTIGDMHYLVALNKPVEIDGKVFNEDYYVSICINKPL